MSNLPSFTKKDLEAYYRRLDLIKQTAEQIIKDFDWYGMEIKFSGDEATAYNELAGQLIPHIQKLLKSDYQKLMQVLYHVDVNEKSVRWATEKGSEIEIASWLTDLIIERELQKVVTRIYFSGRM